jgi:hypothetical protein
MHSTLYIAHSVSFPVYLSLVLAFLFLSRFVFLTEWPLRSKLRLNAYFRLNNGFVAGFLRLNAFDCIHCPLFFFLSVSLSFIFLTEWRLRSRLRLNASGIAAPFPFRFHFRLNDGFVAGFLRLNAFDCIHCSLTRSLFLTTPLWCLLFLFLRQCRLRFRLNCGFVAGFLRLNACGVVDPSFLSDLSPMLFLYPSLLLANSLRCFHFRLNRVGAALRRNAFGFSALSLFLSLYRSLLLAFSQRCFHFRLNGVGEVFITTECIRLLCSPSLYTEWRLCTFRRKSLCFSSPSPFI